MTDRRQVLQVAAVSAAGLLVMPACSRPEAAPATPPAPDAQQADEAALIAAYDAALTEAAAADRPLLQRLRDEHVAHLAALGWQGAPPAVAASATPNRRSLARAERLAARLRAQGARETGDPQTAQVLALIAASEAQHAQLLGAR